jgi:hypothetical protein
MQIDPKDIRIGDDITWKGSGFFPYRVLSTLLWLVDRQSHWDKWSWHTGYIIEITPAGEVVTSQALAGGVQTVTYESVDAMGECRFYRWLPQPVDQTRLLDYSNKNNSEPYDVLDYLWVFLGAISMIYFHHPFRMVNGWKMCWENVSEKDRYLGKELQPEDEPCLISRMVTRLEQ